MPKWGLYRLKSTIRVSESKRQICLESPIPRDMIRLLY
jgi:hypothetical protein